MPTVQFGRHQVGAGSARPRTRTPASTRTRTPRPGTAQGRAGAVDPPARRPGALTGLRCSTGTSRGPPPAATGGTGRLVLYSCRPRSVQNAPAGISSASGGRNLTTSSTAPSAAARSSRACAASSALSPVKSTGAPAYTSNTHSHSPASSSSDGWLPADQAPGAGRPADSGWRNSTSRGRPQREHTQLYRTIHSRPRAPPRCPGRRPPRHTRTGADRGRDGPLRCFGPAAAWRRGYSRTGRSAYRGHQRPPADDDQ